MLAANFTLGGGYKEKMGHKGVQRYHDTSTVAAVVGEKAHLGTK